MSFLFELFVKPQKVAVINGYKLLFCKHNVVENITASQNTYNLI